MVGEKNDEKGKLVEKKEKHVEKGKLVEKLNEKEEKLVKNNYFIIKTN